MQRKLVEIGAFAGESQVAKNLKSYGSLEQELKPTTLVTSYSHEMLYPLFTFC